MDKNGGNVFILGGSLTDLKRIVESPRTEQKNKKNNGMKLLANKYAFMMSCNLLEETYNKCLKEVEKGLEKASKNNDYSPERLEEVVKNCSKILENLLNDINNMID